MTDQQFLPHPDGRDDYALRAHAKQCGRGIRLGELGQLLFVLGMGRMAD
jgi:hypothetical protein